MRAVWKYVLAVDAEQAVYMPRAARILTAAAQGDDICVWAEVDTETGANVPRHIMVVGTGHRFDAPTTAPAPVYIGTAFLRGGSLVFHVFERIA